MIFFTIICLAIIAWGFYGIWFHEREVKQIRAEFAEERQILLNRIQDPKYRPPLNPAEKRADLEKIRELREENEQFGLVGKILE